MKRTIRTFIAKIPLAKPLYNAAKRWRNILVMKMMQPVMKANHQNKRDIEKLIMRLDGKSAMSELYRVLKPGGKAMINVPIKMELKETLQDDRYNTDELRKRYYGQCDHVRQYGTDFEEKLRNAGFNVTVLTPNKDMPDSEIKKYGLLRHEVVYICEK